MRVEVSGRIYDFAVTDITDISWEMFFRKAPEALNIRVKYSIRGQ